MSDTNGQQPSFQGWAKVEIMGHQAHIGFVKTEVYGGAVLFRIDTPELPEREYTLEEPAYVGHKWCPAGTKVRRDLSPGISVLVGAASIYRIIPCTEAAALKAIEGSVRSPLQAISVPELPAGDPEDFEDDDQDDEDQKELPL